MDERAARIQALNRRATVQLISSSTVRDALDDDHAQQMVAWGLAPIRANLSSREISCTMIDFIGKEEE